MLKDKTKLLLYVLLTSPVIAVLKVTSSFRLHVLLKFMLHGLLRLTSGSLVCVLFMFIVWDHTPWTHSQHFSTQETPWITQKEDPRTRFLLSWVRILGRKWDKSLQSFPPCYSQSPLLMDFTPPAPPLSKSGLKLVCNASLYTETSSLRTLKIMPRILNEIVRLWI